MPRKIDKKWVFSDQELEEMIDRAEENHEEYVKDKPVATRFSFDSEQRTVSVLMADKSRMDFPVSKIKELRRASDAEIRSAYITRSGDAIHWDDLDAHYTVAGLAANVFGTKEWMRELGRMGGSKTSAQKAAAAIANGQKGGRPRSSAAKASSSASSTRSAAYAKKAGTSARQKTKTSARRASASGARKK